MTVRVDVAPAVFEWARARSRVDDETLYKRFPKYDQWTSGEVKPTWKQLQNFADGTHTPFGYFFLDEPVQEQLPIPDFRTVGDRDVAEPSVDLLDTIYKCQRRQDWYRDHQRLNNEDPLPFIGTATTDTPIERVAAQITDVFDWTQDTRARLPSWDAALTELRERVDAIGVLLMISGVVGANTHRPLDPDEFRGFVLADHYAPVVFVNGRDGKAAQIFTLVHEIAHLWLGADGVSDLEPSIVRRIPTERWCNQVAAEVLVPLDEFRRVFNAQSNVLEQLQALAERFRVSTEVILGRVREAGYIDWSAYLDLLAEERQRVAPIVTERTSRGGNFYNTKPVQVSKRFARALIGSTLEGHTLYTEAFRMLDVKRQATFDGLGEQLGVV